MKVSVLSLTELGRKLPYIGRLYLIFATALIAVLGASQAAATSETVEVGGIDWAIRKIQIGGEIHYDNSLLVLDGVGHPHLFYSGVKDEADRNVIFYLRPDIDKEPFDVLLTSQGIWSGVILLNAHYDWQTDSILLLWVTGWGGDLVLSHVPVADAYDARKWQNTEITSDVITGDFVQDAEGVLHVIYATFSGGVVEYTYSVDFGETWIPPMGIFWLSDPNDASLTHLRIMQDKAGNLHATWSENNPNAVGVWQPRSVWHAVIAENSGTLVGEIETVFDQGREATVDYLSLWMSDDGGQFLRIANLGAGSTPGRYQQWHETDKWGPQVPILAGESGLGGYSRFFEDSTGRVYMISSAQMPQAGWSGIALRLYLLEGQDWTLQGILARCEFHNVSVFQGNQVHLACRLSDGLYYIKGDIPVPPSIVPQRSRIPLSIGTTTSATQIVGTITPTSDLRDTSLSSTYLNANLSGFPRQEASSTDALGQLLVVFAASSVSILVMILVRRLRMRRGF